MCLSADGRFALSGSLGNILHMYEAATGNYGLSEQYFLDALQDNLLPANPEEV